VILMILSTVFMGKSMNRQGDIDLMPVNVAKVDWDKKFITDVYTVPAN
jgi:hypothetical protein